MKKILFLLMMVLALSLQSSYAQEQPTESPLYLIETKDGNEFIGRIIFEDEEVVQLQTEKFGEIKISRSDIRSMRRLEGTLAQDGSIWVENPQATRYFWAPNGYGLRKGEGYYQNLWVLWNQASVGITDNISIGAGVVPLFLFAGTSTPVWLTPKVSVPIIKDRFNVGGGALVGTVVGEEDMGFGIVYGVSTLGSRDRNITFGLGYGYAAGEWAQSPMINVSGMLRISKNGYLLTENYYISLGGGNEGISILSLGGRWMIRKVGLDFGLFVPVSEDLTTDSFVAFPWLGFSVPFGSVK